MVSNNKGECSRHDGVHANAMIVNWKKERSKALRWTSSKNGVRSRRKEGVPFQPMLSASTSTYPMSGKRVGHHGMVVEDSDAVDPATVPRKLRSAINKRSNKLSSSAAPNAKKHHPTTSGLRMLGENGERRSKDCLMHGSLTQDEEDVLEALCALSRGIDEQTLDEEDGKLSKDPQEDNHATLATYSEGVKCTAGGIKNPSFSCTETPSGETNKDEHACSEQPITDCQKKTIISKLDTHAAPFSDPDFHCFDGNRVVHTTNCNAVIAVPSCKPDLPRLNGSLPSNLQSASRKSIPRSGSMCGAPKHLSSRIDPSTEKVPACIGPPWKKCVIHVSICRLIKDHQAKEEQLKRPPSSVPAKNEKSWLQIDETKGENCVSLDSYFVGRNKCEGRDEASGTARFSIQPTVLSEAKPMQTCDFLASSSRGGGGSASANAVKSTGQLRAPFLHAQVPPRSAVPFPFARAPYAPPYTDRLLAATSQQSQLLVAQFATDSMPSHLLLPLAQQQAHFAHSRPLANPASTVQHERPIWQNAQHPKSTYSPTTYNTTMQGEAHQSSLPWHELQLIANSASSLSISNHRQPQGNKLNGSSFQQLHLLCYTNRS